MNEIIQFRNDIMFHITLNLGLISEVLGFVLTEVVLLETALLGSRHLLKPLHLHLSFMSVVGVGVVPPMMVHLLKLDMKGQGDIHILTVIIVLVGHIASFTHL